MSTQFPDLVAALAAPFRDDEVKTRQGGGGRQLAYITARTAMNRLDEVLGPENWWDSYRETKDGLTCRLTIRLPEDGQEYSKEDGGGFADMPDEDDAEKSGYSSAFKRAAVKFGVGRYLYRDGVPSFAAPLFQGQPRERTAPAQERPERAREPRHEARGDNGNGNTPRDGRGLWAWLKKQEEAGEADILKRASAIAKRHDFPDRIVSLNEEQARVIYGELRRGQS